MCWLYTLPAIRNHIFATIAILLSHFAFNGYALRCFVCDSTDNPSCADLKSNSSLVAEECNLLNMKSNTSWLFELNALAFYKTSTYSNPLFDCQKVVAREPRTNHIVTARFCQLQTADSDACKILRNKMAKQEADRQSLNGYGMSMNMNNGGRRGDGSGSRRNTFGGNDDENANSEDILIHCSICSEDRCNAGIRLLLEKESLLLHILLVTLPLMLRHFISTT